MPRTDLIVPPDGDARPLAEIAAPNAVPERISFTRRADLPGIEVMRQEHSARLWRLVSPGFAIGGCDADSVDGVFSEQRYRGRWGTLAGVNLGFYEPEEPIVTRRVGAAMNGHVLVLTAARAAAELADLELEETPRFVRPIADDRDLHALFGHACTAFEDDAIDATEREHHVRKFLVAAFGFAGMPTDAARPGCTGTAQRVRELLHDRFSEPLTLQMIADAIGRSKYHLEHAFKNAIGLAIYEYLQRVRIERATAMLRGGRRPREVANLVGLADQPHLNRLFRNVLGVTPGAYARAVGGRA